MREACQRQEHSGGPASTDVRAGGFNNTKSRHCIPAPPTQRRVPRWGPHHQHAAPPPCNGGAPPCTWHVLHQLSPGIAQHWVVSRGHRGHRGIAVAYYQPRKVDAALATQAQARPSAAAGDALAPAGAVELCESPHSHKPDMALKRAGNRGAFNSAAEALLYRDTALVSGSLYALLPTPATHTNTQTYLQRSARVAPSSQLLSGCSPETQC